ncbi:hypothetical protein [Ktedonobacter robiniae]|uniref:hypothetical protein n=1 Tax=Ktedonobacter robiniae TaxID=2778365 RepID=UPI001916A256|nr:hypothetical protein [Ktedonobacter robiniae]
MVSPDSESAVLTLQGKCSRFRAQPAHLISHLPLAPGDSWLYQERSLLLSRSVGDTTPDNWLRPAGGRSRTALMVVRVR